MNISNGFSDLKTLIAFSAKNYFHEQSITKKVRSPKIMVILISSSSPTIFVCVMNYRFNYLRISWFFTAIFYKLAYNMHVYV